MTTSDDRPVLARLTARAEAMAARLGESDAAAQDWAEARNPPRGRFIEVEGVRLHVVEAGEGPPLLFVHGAGGMVEDLLISPLYPLLTRRFRVVALDRPGYGWSDRPRPRVYAGPIAQARLVTALSIRLGLDRPLLVGHSWGGAVVLAQLVSAMARERPDFRPSGALILAGWSHPAMRFLLFLAGLPALPVIGARLAPMMRRRLTGRAAPILRRIFSPEPVSADFADFPIEMSLRPSQLAAGAEDIGTLNRDVARLARHYKALALPIEILAGTADAMVRPADHAQRLAADLPQAGLQLLPGRGHMLHHTNPLGVLAAVERLAGVASGGIA